MVRRPEPATVWLVRPPHPEAARGTLSLTQHDLVFSGDGGEEERVPVERIRTARRRLGTPILVVRYREAGGTEAEAFLYFARPPALSTREDLRARRRPFVPSGRGLERSASIMALRGASGDLRAVIRGWVAAIRLAADR